MRLTGIRRTKTIVISTCLIHIAPTLPTDVSALESSISALERVISALESEIKALDSSSAPWERWLSWAIAAVVVGLVMEYWVIWRDRRDEWHAFRLGIVRFADRPSLLKYVVELVSVSLVTLGVLAEFGIGIRIASINVDLRGKSAALRGKNSDLRTASDRLVALLGAKAESERLARVKIEAAVAWRKLTEDQKSVLASHLKAFAPQSAFIEYNHSDIEANEFGFTIASALAKAKWEVPEPWGIMLILTPSPLKSKAPSRIETGVLIDSTGDKRSAAAAKKLCRELGKLGFDAVEGKAPPPRPGKPTVTIFVRYRPEGAQGEFKLQADREAQATNKDNSKH
jgi:hypothetical protein